MRRYVYVGPAEIRDRVAGVPAGSPIRTATDLLPFAHGEPMTFVVDEGGVLRVAERRSEHVACAAGGNVLSAGELIAVRGDAGPRIVEISNQSTGYCPEPESWPSVATALDAAGIGHPGRFTYEARFRRCPRCGERNLVKEQWFECALCGEALPRSWNFI
jgi:hypothetical protein